MKKITLITVITINYLLITINLFSQPCLPEGIIFSSQAEIDSFQTNYPNCTEIEGDVGIGEWPGSDITNLNGLNVLTSLGGDLHIQQNPLLMDLSGLDNLISIWELWVLENESLQNLTGLNNLSSIYGEISISSNEELTSLTGLEGLTSIESLRISNPSLVNLDGLNNLINVNDLLEISYNSSLQSLSGLENLTTIGGRLHIANNNELVNLTGLDNLNSVGGDLTIGSYGINAVPNGLYCEGNPILDDLTALSNLTNIGGNLGIFCNDTLTNLSGLENLSAIGGGLHIGYYWGWQSAGNPSLTSITGLEGLTFIEGDIEIQGNLSLKNLTGLENIEATTIENIIIRYNDSLSYCEVQSVCNYLSNPGGVVEIYGNATGCNDPAEIANACGFTMSCLPYGSYCFTYQTAIDSFQYWYPGCSALEGKVFISGKDITNLGGLEAVTSIGSTLQVRDTDSLPNLTGLNNVVSIGGDLLIGDIYMGVNESLTSLTGLENLTSIGGDINISGNNVLASLAGIDNINAGSIISLDIIYNDTLSACAVQSICDYLSIPNGYVNIYGNASGCNSQEEVEEACSSSCLPEGITFSTQAEIDSFQTNYPNCTEIEGDVIINGQDINNLNGLNVLTAIGGTLEISHNEMLTTLTGLENLTSIGQSLFIVHTDTLYSLTGLEGLTTIDGVLHVEGNNKLIDFTGLDNISTIGSNFYVDLNGSLEDFHGLENLISIGGDLLIGGINIAFWIGNPSLVALSGLENLTTVGGGLTIAGNYILSNLIALTGLNYVGEGLSIFLNPSLAECDIQSICEYLASPNGLINIYDNAPGCNNPEEVEEACEVSCLSQGITFTTQEEIDNFQANYPNCSEIEGDVEIKGEDIANLNGLNVLTSIGGYLDFDNNSMLTSLMGLSNLTFLGDGLRINGSDTLQSLNGLEGLSNISNALSVYHNPNLINLSGLDNITSIGEDLIIDLNFDLENLSGLENLTVIGGDFYIGGVHPAMWHGNPSLITLTHLANLSSIGGDFVIAGNGSLTNLSGIDNINANTISNLEIWQNGNLSFCDVQSICDYLAAPNGTIKIHDNSPGCNSPEEVVEACAQAVDEVSVINNLSIHPNPFSNTITIEFETKQPENITISIYNHLGEKVKAVTEYKSFGHQKIEWDCKGLPAGIYFCVLKTNQGIITTKMIKL